MTYLVLFLKLPVGLVDQLHQVNVGDIQFQVAGTGFGSLHQILGQILKAVGLLFEDIQVTLYFFILDLFPL